MTYQLTVKSKMRLDGVHRDLVKVVMRAYEITDANFFVLEGVRTLEQEQKNFAAGASQTMHSRHLTGHAIDIGALDEKGVLTWEWEYYDHLYHIFMKAAENVGVPVEWGGLWKTLKDGGHYQLPWAVYPVAQHVASVDSDPAEPVAAPSSSQSPFEGGGSGG